MKKIMFDDKYGLTDSVLQGRKTMTRRIIPQLMSDKDFDISEWGINDQGKVHICLYEGGRPTTDIFPAYQPGEVVAVAQSYECMANSGYLDRMMETSSTFKKEYCGVGWNNKMFVRADLMPHQIRITDIKVERLQDISDEDIMKEGITYIAGGGYGVRFGENYNTFALNPMVAFAVLIDNISGKGTWESNPYVFSYTFKLLK